MENLEKVEGSGQEEEEGMERKEGVKKEEDGEE